MNSVHKHCPKQCTVTKLGCVHSAHTQKQGRVHTARAAPRSWALLRAQPTSRAQASAGSAHRVPMLRACWACTGRNTPKKPAPCRDLKNPGRDTKLTHIKRARSRHQNPSRDLIVPALAQARSQRQI